MVDLLFPHRPTLCYLTCLPCAWQPPRLLPSSHYTDIRARVKKNYTLYALTFPPQHGHAQGSGNMGRAQVLLPHGFSPEQHQRAVSQDN